MKRHSAMNRILGAATWLRARLRAGSARKRAGAGAGRPTGSRPSTCRRCPASSCSSPCACPGPATEPLSFTIDNPARISFDLPNTALALPSRRIDVRSAGLDSILAAEAKDRTRLVLNLDRLMPYQTRVDGNNIIVMLGSRSRRAAWRPPRLPSAQPSSAPAAASGARAIRAIDFRRGADGAGRVVVKLTDPRTQINLRQLGNQIVVDFAGAELPKNLMRRYDATDFGTPDHRLRRRARRQRHAPRHQRHGRLRAARLPVRRSVRRRSAAGAQGRRRAGRQARVHRRAPDPQLPGHRDARRAAAARGRQRPEHRGQRLGDAATSRCACRTCPGIRRSTSCCAPRASTSASRTTSSSSRRPKSWPRARRRTSPRKKDIQELAPLRAEFVQVNYAKAADMAELIKSQAAARCCRRAARSRSTSAPTRCCCRTRPTGSRTSAAWSRRSTFRSARC